ncbi:peroxidase [Lophiostoma macrostomum CBS 122681]|uniref:Peroxidase n=1 Tax=Lophiostoma macrostomum CBS 122681 TaxID=1314788 RepID=A0A6A6SXG5_9PLEO|nr:peroxidase [Lophiostoma macrostomum CBS 122681]
MATCLSTLSLAEYPFHSKAIERSVHQAHAHPWTPAGPGDVRAPCPMLNTLANHGYLPHNGRDISQQNTIDALGQALNINSTLAVFLHQEALTTNPAPNATTFSLDDLSRHNVLEHDASLSRLDAYFGDNHDFNQAVFDETRSYWTSPIINITTAAAALAARKETSNTTNPTFVLSDIGRAFGFGETAAYILILGNKTTATVERSLVEYLFENERLPLELGWTRSAVPFVEDDLFTLLDRVVNATGADASLVKRAGLHGGRRV